MDLTLRQPGVTVVLGAERMPLARALEAVLAPGVAVAALSRGAAPPGAARLPAPASADAVLAWLRAQEGPAIVVVDGLECMRGDLAGEAPDLHLLRLVQQLRPDAAHGIVVLEALSAPRGETGIGPALAAEGAHVRHWDAARGRVGLSPAPPVGLDRLGRPAFTALLLLVLAAAVALVVGPSLAAEAGTVRLLGDIQRDLGTHLWAAWLVDHQVQRAASLNRTGMALWPVGTELLPLVGSLGTFLLSLPFQWALGLPRWWNPFLLCGLVSSGAAAAWLARSQGADRAGALVAGTLFATAPALIDAVGSGNLLVVWAAPLPLAIGLGLRALSGSGRDATLAGLAFALASLCWWFHAAFAAAVVLTAAGLRLLSSPALRPQLRGRLARMGRVWLPTVLLAIPVVSADNQDVRSATGFLRLPWREAEAHLAREAFDRAVQQALPLDHVLPLPGLDHMAWVAALLGPSVVVLWGLRHFGRRWLWPASFAGASVLALGAWLSPEAGLADGWLPLPLAFLVALAPALSHVDEPARFMVLGTLAAAVMAGRLVSLARPEVRRGRRTLALVAVLLGACALPRLSGVTPVPGLDWEPPAWARYIGGRGVVIELPLGWSHASALWQPVHGNPVAGGPGEVAALRDATPYRHAWETVEPLPWFWRLRAAPMDEAQRAELLRLGVRYVVVHQQAIEQLATGAASGRSWFLPVLAARVDQALGPPIIDAEGVRVYGVAAP